MKKVVIILLIVTTGCYSKLEGFEKFKQSTLDDMYGDSGWSRQLDESGLGKKLQNAPGYDSFMHYRHLFYLYNDSVIRSQAHKDSTRPH